METEGTRERGRDGEREIERGGGRECKDWTREAVPGRPTDRAVSQSLGSLHQRGQV